MRTKSGLKFAFGLLCFIGLVWVINQWARRHPPQTKDLHFKNPLSLLSPHATATGLPKTNQAHKNFDELKAKIKNEALKMAEIDQNPAQTKAQLNEWAQALDFEDLEILVDESLNQSLSQDERFLGAMLLALNSSAQSISLLQKLASAPFSETQQVHNASNAIEWMVRAQAIEGFEKFAQNKEQRLAAKNALESTIENLKQPFLETRARQVLETFKRPPGSLPSIEKRDEEALKKMIQK